MTASREAPLTGEPQPVDNSTSGRSSAASRIETEHAALLAHLGITPADPTTTPAIYVEGDFRIKQSCGFPAPLVANGAPFVGCQLDKDHDGLHKVEITWGLRA